MTTKAAAKAKPTSTAFTTDAPRPGPIGERSPPTEAELIAADAAAAKAPKAAKKETK